MKYLNCFISEFIEIYNNQKKIALEENYKQIIVLIIK